MAVRTPQAGCHEPAWKEVNPSMQICYQRLEHGGVQEEAKGGRVAKTRRTHLLAQLEAPVGREQDDVGRAHRIACRQDDAEMVQAALVVGPLDAAEGTMPLEYVGLA